MKFYYILVLALALICGVFSEEHDICKLVDDHEESLEKIVKCHTDNIPGELLNRVYNCAVTDFPVTNFHDFFTEGCDEKITDLDDKCIEIFDKYMEDNNVFSDWVDGVGQANRCLQALARTYNIQELEEIF